MYYCQWHQTSAPRDINHMIDVAAVDQQKLANIQPQAITRRLCLKCVHCYIAVYSTSTPPSSTIFSRPNNNNNTSSSSSHILFLIIACFEYNRLITLISTWTRKKRTVFCYAATSYYYFCPSRAFVQSSTHLLAVISRMSVFDDSGPGTASRALVLRAIWRRRVLSPASSWTDKVRRPVHATDSQSRRRHCIAGQVDAATLETRARGRRGCQVRVKSSPDSVQANHCAGRRHCVGAPIDVERIRIFRGLNE